MTTIIEACRRGDFDIAEALDYSKKNKYDYKGGINAAIIAAAEYGELDILKYLFGHKKRLGKPTKDKFQLKIAIQEAENNKNNFLLEYLHDRKSCINDICIRLALIASIKNGHINVIKYIELFEPINGDVDMINAAAEYGHLDIVKHMLKNNRFSYDKSFDACENPLFFAAINNHIDVVKFLIEKDVHLHIILYIVFEEVCAFSNIDIVIYLLEFCDINVWDGMAIRSAARHGRMDVVRYFTTKKIEVVPRNLTIIDAAQYGHLDIIKLLKNHPDANLAFMKSFALRNAVDGKYIETVKYLCNNGADAKQALFACHDNIDGNILKYLLTKITPEQHEYDKNSLLYILVKDKMPSHDLFRHMNKIIDLVKNK